jgi:hypothetical protein
MSPWLSLGISCLALFISGITAWLTFFRKGKLVMTQPTVVFFGPDGSRFESGKNKIYLRTLLYSTAKRGQVLESLHVSLRRNESKQNFNIWVYDDKDKLKRGSGCSCHRKALHLNIISCCQKMAHTSSFFPELTSWLCTLSWLAKGHQRN